MALLVALHRRMLHNNNIREATAVPVVQDNDTMCEDLEVQAYPVTSGGSNFVYAGYGQLAVGPESGFKCIELTPQLSEL
jgi:hypothetical protein